MLQFKPVFCRLYHNIFLKWHQDTRKKIVEVQVDGRPRERVVLLTAATGVHLMVASPSNTLTRICVSLCE